MEAVAKTKYLKGSPRKTRLVIDMIRGENVSRALAILKFTDKRAADPIAQCLSSAIANATYKAEQQNIAIDPDDLWVKTCFVDMGPTKGRKRMRPAPQGRAYREQRHYCHITIHVTSEEQPKIEKELRAEAAKAKKAAEGGKAKPKKAKPAVKKAEKAKVEEVETVVETPVVEAVAEPAAAEVVGTPAAEAPAVEENAAETTVDNTEETSEETAKE
ncbi:MAG TPA: 50S ribosomal protein L22 [Pyrinomonadaceae bacterium]|nr:50S ribosomal protein L22 [Pyrinomonadaceae bacterium]